MTRRTHMAAFVAAVSFAVGTASMAAQSKQSAPNPKSTSAAKPKAAAPDAFPPRTPDGQPNITGVWGSIDTGIYSLNWESLNHLRSLGMPAQRSGAQSAAGSPQASSSLPALVAYAKGKGIVVDPPDGVIPYQPWALERRNNILKNYGHPEAWQVDSQTRGWPNGVPRENIYSTADGSIGGPIQILQPKGHVLFLYETHHEFRVVPLDGRA